MEYRQEKTLTWSLLIQPEFGELQPQDILHTEHWSPFLGKQLTGKVARSMVRGVSVFGEDLSEKIGVKPGFGKYVGK